MTSEPSCRRSRSVSDDNAGDDPPAEPLTPWPVAGTFAPTLPLQRIKGPVFTLLTVVTVGPVTLIEPSIFPEAHPAAKPTATSARPRIAFIVSVYTPRRDGCQSAQGSFRNTGGPPSVLATPSRINQHGNTVLR